MQQHTITGLIFVTQLSMFTLPAMADTSTEPDLFDDLPVITSASRLNQSILSSPSAVTVIDRAMIEASGFIEIADIFRLVPGFQVAQTDLNGFAVVNHGNGWEYPSQMQLLIDGRSTYTSALSAIDWDTLGITIEDIERVEVVRGPAASAYGSNSFAGAINIITKAPELDDTLHLGYRFGNNGERRLLLRHSNTIGDLSYRVTGSERDNGGFDDHLDSRHLNDFGITSRYNLNPKNSFFAHFSTTNGKAGMPGITDTKPGETPDFYDRDRSVEAWSAHLRWDHIVSETEEVKVNFFHNFRDENDMTASYPTRIIEVGERTYHSHRSDLEVQYSAVLDSGLQYVIGAGGRYDTMNSEAFFIDKGTVSSSSFRTFGNVQIPLSQRFTANLGGLYETSNLIDKQLFSPRASLTWHINDRQSIRTTYSKAYRIPSLLEKNMDLKLVTTDGTVVGYEFLANDKISAEKVEAVDIGYLGQAATLPLSWELRAYREEYDDLILFYSDDAFFMDASDNEVERIGNAASTTMYGFEGAITYRPEQNSFLRFHFNTGHETGYEIETVNHDGLIGDTEFNDVSNNVPRKSYGVLAAKAIGSWQFNLGVYHVGKVRWASRGDEVDSYTRVDASVSKRFRLKGSEEIVLRLGGQNIGNSQYYEFDNDEDFGLLYEPRYFASITYLNF